MDHETELLLSLRRQVGDAAREVLEASGTAVMSDAKLLVWELQQAVNDCSGLEQELLDCLRQIVGDARSAILSTGTAEVRGLRSHSKLIEAERALNGRLMQKLLDYFVLIR